MDAIMDLYQYAFGGDLANVLFTISAIVFCWVLSFKHIVSLRIGFIALDIYGIMVSIFIVGWYGKGVSAFVFASAIFITVNAFLVYRYYKERDINLIPQSYRQLYSQTFSLLTPYEFMLMVNASEKKQVEGTLIKNRQVLENIFVVLDGVVHVTPANAKPIELSGVNILGEVGVLSDKIASATVDAVGNITVLQLSLDKLEKLFQRYPNFKTNIYQIFTLEVRNKIIAMNNFKIREI